MTTPLFFQINFVGDVMLGRLIDQLLPNHVDEPSEARIVEKVRRTNPKLRDYSIESPWGNTLPLLQSSDLRVINLETSVTTHPVPWPEKMFNYRMHPANIDVLKTAQIDYAGLGNNHTLDFGEEGLIETVNTLSANGIQFAGAGRTADEAQQPAYFYLPKTTNDSNDHSHMISIHSASDQPYQWARVPTFHLVDYTPAAKSRLQTLLRSPPAPSLKIFSIHWGPNYAWHPAPPLVALAHFLVDECGVDIVHGHSSHHVQGIERYHGALIIYGCGDFVDDYALMPEFRNDLSAVWRVTVNESEDRLKLRRLEVFPTRCKDFQVNLLDVGDVDHAWVCEKVVELSRATGMKELPFRGKDGQLVIEL